MSGIASAISAPPSTSVQALLTDSAATPPSQDLQVREKFQDFVAGTFYKQMLKTLRSGQKKPAYFHGGRAEEVFQNQMDQVVTDNLAKSHGKAFADPLFSAYSRTTQ